MTPYGPPPPQYQPIAQWPSSGWQRCPVCHGKGTVPAGFYGHHSFATETGAPTKCKSCSGRGIVR